MEPQSPTPSVRPYPTIKQAWFYMLVMVLINIVISLAILGFGAAFTGTIVQNNWTILIGYSLTFTLALFYGWRRFTKAAAGGRVFTFYFPQFRVISLLFFTTLGILVILDPIVNLLPMPEWFYRIMERLVADHELSNFIMLCVAAPLLEELIFRGIVLNGFLRNYSPRKAIIWSALLFGLVHLNPWQFIPGLVLGLFLGWIYYRTGSLLPGVFVHFVANGTSFVLSIFVDTETGWEVTTAEMIGNHWIYAGILIAALAVVTIGLNQLNNSLRAMPKP